MYHKQVNKKYNKIFQIKSNNFIFLYCEYDDFSIH